MNLTSDLLTPNTDISDVNKLKANKMLYSL